MGKWLGVPTGTVVNVFKTFATVSKFSALLTNQIPWHVGARCSSSIPFKLFSQVFPRAREAGGPAAWASLSHKKERRQINQQKQRARVAADGHDILALTSVSFMSMSPCSSSVWCCMSCQGYGKYTHHSGNGGGAHQRTGIQPVALLWSHSVCCEWSFKQSQ